MKTYTIILCLLLLNCTHTISKKEKNNIMDAPKKTIIMNNRDFNDIMKLEKLKAVKKYGKPLKEESLRLEDMQGEFWNGIQDVYIRKDKLKKPVFIEELTWEKDSVNYITVWYQNEQKKSLPKHFLIWDKGAEF